MSAEDAAKERVARNEALFRQVNERVREVSDAFAAVDPSPIEFVCECGREDCTEPVPLTLPEYERVRSVATQFVVVPGHVISEVESVVERRDLYVVVEKHPQQARIAQELDPRAPP